MENLQKDFLPYELSLKMKQLGFDKPCLAKYITSDLVVKGCYKDSHILHALFEENEICEAHILVPTFSQAFKWFRDKHDLVAAILPFQDIEDRVSLCYYYSIVDLDECKDEDILCNESSLGASDINFSSHPEAELACLVKLIDIIENK
jgi:hypothetical protein